VEMSHVRYFLALCQERSFTRAAHRRGGVKKPNTTWIWCRSEGWRLRVVTDVPPARIGRPPMRFLCKVDVGHPTGHLNDRERTAGSSAAAAFKRDELQRLQ
jgi:hypothetical protein